MHTLLFTSRIKGVCLGRWGVLRRNESDKKLKFPAGSPFLFSSMGMRKYGEKRVNIHMKTMSVISQCDLRLLE